jgi:hypothetical protein
MSRLVLKRARASRPSRQWRDDDYDVLENGVVVGRIFCREPRRRTVPGCGHRATTATYAARPGYEPTREAAMAAFAKSLAEGKVDQRP